MLEAIQQKVDGQEITAEPHEAPQTKIIDLMDALKASLAKRGASTEERKPARRRCRGWPRTAAKPKKSQRGALRHPESGEGPARRVSTGRSRRSPRSR